MPYGCTSREVVSRQVGYHITVTVAVVAVVAMCISTDEAPVASSASVSPVSSTSHVRILLLFTSRSRTPVDGVQAIAELIRGCELPFTDDGPDDNRATNTSRDDDDSNDRVARQVTAAP